MRFLTYTMIAVTTVFTVSAHAKSLDEARRLSAEIAKATGGIQVLADNLHDEEYPDEAPVKNLNTVLTVVLHAQNLSSKTPAEIGEMVMTTLAAVTQRGLQEKDLDGEIMISVHDAQHRFCGLAKEELFSKQISADICKTERAGNGSELLKTFTFHPKR